MEPHAEKPEEQMSLWLHLPIETKADCDKRARTREENAAKMEAHQLARLNAAYERARLQSH